MPTGLDGDASDLARGKLLYQNMNCASCYGLHGGGGIGPALSDDRWIYGWRPEIIFDTITHGRPNGMPAFGGRLADRQAWQIVGYVRSLSGLGLTDAAPGRGDEMAGGTPPNSADRAHPRSSRAALNDLRRQEDRGFAALGWIDSASGRVQVPAPDVRAVAAWEHRAGARVRPTKVATAPAR